ncbi:ribose 1,5-bisphosphokinase [Marinobacter sp. TBZ242]|uniref:Ribose 1,5-bisphosphate phosphokinase PhnN n=1 Tax=Marinobacter azerbaijanicus TaxID=3050455 RepID=A0ABT7IC08_9GAMM|nr:ribose 1,5-bisphosphokinase [Marinobacter sp. TBZ242]MDL0431687.1 ribose 1,5-bisphosphokinase [Marinobacter sp. TBZ242]
MSGSSSQRTIEAGSGRLFYLMGASGAGKDTLLKGCRDRSDNEFSPLVAHRYITREPDGGTESHVWLSDAEFEQRVAMNAFAMHWSANGFRYGIGREIDHWLAEGGQVLVNGSRGYLDEARSRYGSMLIPILIKVDPHRLQRRLRLRGRECAEEIEARTRRARELEQQLPPDCLVIENNGSAEEAISRLLRVIAEQQTSHTTCYVHKAP